MNIPDITQLKPSQFREIVIKKNYPEFYQYLINNYTNSISFSEKIYWYYNNINKCPVCPICGKKVKYINSNLGYATYCSKTCSNRSSEKIEKTKQICIEKYGGIAPVCSSEVKTKMKLTMLDRYGVENCQQNKDIHEKTKQTIINKYGGQGNASKELYNKYKETCIDKYGFDNPSKSDIVREQISEARRRYEIENHNHIINYIEVDGKTMCLCKCPHENCNKCNEKQYIINPTILANRLSHNIELCTKLLPYKPLTSSYEILLGELLNNYNIEYETNVRGIISKELDIYIPSKNIAIEFNGVYAHSDNRKPNNYHVNKFNECKAKNIKLITIWEDQYLTKYNIVKSVLLSKLGIYENVLYGRNCKTVKIDSKTANSFYINNHLQGQCNASIHYGLEYNNELISVMSFGKRALGKKYDNCWELIRYSSKTDTCIVGGVSKLFKAFVSDYNPNQIVSWSSNDISDGHMYKLLGFQYDKISSSYWYVSKKTLKRYHRSNFSKSNLIDKGIISNDDNRSEKDITNELGMLRIFDSGQSKWIWQK